MSKTAVIIGASGLVGSELLDLLLADPQYSKVVSLGRRTLEIEHEKLQQITGDMFEASLFENIPCDHAFVCIGTTQSKTPDLGEYRKIDFGIPVNAAKALLKQRMQKYLVVSSMGAKASSGTFYLKTKGQMEEALTQMDIPFLYILRPSLLYGQRNEFRLGERVSMVFMKFLAPLIPSKYRAISATTVAKAMLKLAHSERDSGIFESGKLAKLGKDD